MFYAKTFSAQIFGTFLAG